MLVGVTHLTESFQRPYHLPVVWSSILLWGHYIIQVSLRVCGVSFSFALRCNISYFEIRSDSPVRVSFPLNPLFRVPFPFQLCNIVVYSRLSKVILDHSNLSLSAPCCFRISPQYSSISLCYTLTHLFSYPDHQLFSQLDFLKYEVQECFLSASIYKFKNSSFVAILTYLIVSRLSRLAQSADTCWS